ncbi:MAG: NusG domain II-containing protein [Spirochaetaceae bacterium]|jgi:hypothetical protein|nr:NusG domain II-containing protein [Spirochaetaceae bacterium]
MQSKKTQSKHLQSKRLLLRPLDILVIAFAVLTTAFSGYLVYGRQDEADEVLIECMGKKWVYPLTANEEVLIPGPLGASVVRISGEKAWVDFSPCPNQTCVQTGSIHHAGDWVACLPNQVFVSVQSKGQNEGDSLGIDAFSR